MSKGHLPAIARLRDADNGDALTILFAVLDAKHYAEIYGAREPGVPMHVSRADLESLRDQIDAWLKANPA